MNWVQICIQKRLICEEISGGFLIWGDLFDTRKRFLPHTTQSCSLILQTGITGSASLLLHIKPQQCFWSTQHSAQLDNFTLLVSASVALQCTSRCSRTELDAADTLSAHFTLHVLPASATKSVSPTCLHATHPVAMCYPPSALTWETPTLLLLLGCWQSLAIFDISLAFFAWRLTFISCR